MTHVPALREALHEVADRRYGRRRIALRWAGFALAPAAAATAVILVLQLSAPVAERSATPTAKAHTVRITALTPTRRPLRFPKLTVMPRAEAEAAFAAVQDTSAGTGTLIRAWSLSGVEGAAVFFTRSYNDLCVATRDLSVADPIMAWGAACGDGYREYGVSLVVGDTYAGVLGPESRSPQYRAPDGRRRKLPVSDARVVMVQGAQDRSGVLISGLEVETVTLPRTRRYHCSDGTSRDVVVDPRGPRPGPQTDPCATHG
jgi:hypothetical protein